MNQNHLRRLPAIGVALLIVLAQIWFWSRLFTSELILAHSDLYEQFLPVFRAPMVLWSSSEFAGLPVAADPQNTMWYPLHLLFARLVQSWSWYVVSAYVVAAAGAAAYAWQITRSRAAAILAGLAWPWSEAMADLFPHLAMLHGFAWLPWILFGFERLAATQAPRWIGLTAFFFGCLALSGHPQVSVYCAYLVGAYALTLWLVSGRSPRLAGSFVGTFALGALLAAVQVVPTVEAASWIARDQVGFAQFAESFAKQPHELMTVLVPQFCHERREAPSYAGVMTLWLAVVALAVGAREWRVRFWLAVAVVGLILGLGSLTPLARVVYELPLYDRFRVVARHLALYSFAVIALAALGMAAIRDGRLSSRRALLVAAGTAVVAAAGLAWVAATPTLFNFSCNGHGFGRFFPALLTDVRMQAGLAAAAAVLVIAGGRPRWRRAALIAMPAVLAADLLNAQSESVDLAGLQPPTMIDARLLEPSVHARSLAARLAPAHQRLLPLEGSATDPVLPGAFARLWQVPSLGGYNPLLPERLTRLALMDANGAVRPAVLLDDDATLDMFAVKYLIVRASELQPGESVPGGMAPAELPRVDRVIGFADCRPRGTMTMTLRPAVPVAVRAVVVVSRLRCGDNVPNEARIGAVTLGDGAALASIPMRAATTSHPEILTVANGEIAAAGLTPFRVELPAPMTVDRVTIETSEMPASMQLDAAALETVDGRLVPLVLPVAALANSPRWVERERFSTSRDSDRGVDGPGRDEMEYVVFENLRARPRAWFAGDVVEVGEDDAVETVRFGRMRDGRPWDVSRTAFVLPGERVQGGGGTGDVRIDGIRDGQFDLTVNSATAGLVVISELHHRGWTATVDGVSAPVVRANHALMGVAVPAGEHTVTLSFDPVSVKAGAAVSGVALLAMAGCLAGWPRRRRREGHAGV